MQAFVTGGTGFVGAHVVRALLRRGAHVRALVRPGSRLDNLNGLDIEQVQGDLCDPEGLEHAIQGSDLVFHCAADYRLHVPDPAAMYATNVDGTDRLLRAARDCGVRRVVYTSTVGALAIDPEGRPTREDTPVSVDEMVGPYKRSKFLAEGIALDWARRGLDVVVVNPSTPVGELDIKPTPTGQIVVDFLAGRMGAYVDTGLNLVDVRDVAEGHVLAAEHGRAGEKYILGHANVTLKQMLDRLAPITGRRAPRVRLPHWVPLAAARVDNWLAGMSHRTPRLAVDAVKLSRYKMYFDAGKAVRELGLPQTPVDDALARAVQWFRSHGYVGSLAS